MHEQARQSRRAFCGSVARFTTALAFFPFAELLVGCGPEQKKSISRPTVQINDTNVIPNTRYIGEAFAFPEQAVTASLMPQSDRIFPYAPGITFLGVIAQDTRSFDYDSINPADIARVGMFKQNNGTFRYGYEINGVRHYASGHVVSSDYKYNIDFRINEEGLVADPDHPHETRFGYDFRIASGWNNFTQIQGIQSSPIYADQLFVGVMDDGDAVQLPNNKKLQLTIVVSGAEQTPSVIYTNGDNSSQVSSEYSDEEDNILLILSGGYYK